MGHASHIRLTEQQLNEPILSGAVIYGPDDERVGSVAEVHGSGHGAQVVIDVGGFLGIGAKPVALPCADIDFMRDENGDVHGVTQITREALDTLPRHGD